MQLRAQYRKGLNLPTTNAIKAFGIQITNQKTQRLDEHPLLSPLHSLPIYARPSSPPPKKNKQEKLSPFHKK